MNVFILLGIILLITLIFIIILLVCKKNNDSKKIIGYSCSKVTGNIHDCRGMIDRFIAMINLYIIADLTNRKFVIYHSKPCKLETFFVPNKYNWICNDNIGKKIEQKDYTVFSLLGHPANRPNYGPYNLEAVNFNKILPKNDLTFITTTQRYDYTELVKNNPLYKNKLSLPSGKLWTSIFNKLFKPSAFFQKELNKFLPLFKNSVIGMHIRLGDWSMPEVANKSNKKEILFTKKTIFNIFNFLKHNIFNKFPNSKFLICTDNIQLSEFIKNTNHPHIITIPGTPKNIMYMSDAENQNDIPDTLKMLLDFYLLGECNIIYTVRKKREDGWISRFSHYAKLRSGKPDNRIIKLDFDLESE